MTVVELSDELRPVARVPSGASLVEREAPGGAVVELRAADGSLLVEYLPKQGACRIHASAVQLRADTDLSLSAGRRVHIEAKEGVELRSGASAFAVEPERVTTVAERVDTEAKRIAQRAGELETHARQILERAERSFREVEDLAQTKAGRLRLVATETLRALARQTFIKAREDMKLRGERIYLE
ncbi:MAG: DUF3540 domain-containing protein [Myxococcales bacterium]|nr:DUF3540 domain-containing protein [Myxococcales bacterium]